MSLRSGAELTDLSRLIAKRKEKEAERMKKYLDYLATQILNGIGQMFTR